MSVIILEANVDCFVNVRVVKIIDYIFNIFYLLNYILVYIILISKEKRMFHVIFKCEIGLVYKGMLLVVAYSIILTKITIIFPIFTYFKLMFYSH